MSEPSVMPDPALGELLFPTALLIKLCCGVERESYISCSLGLPYIYRIPAFRADDFIRINKAPQCLRELLAALRILANETVIDQVTREPLLRCPTCICCVMSASGWSGK
jgi:hypothetical protein